MTLGELKSWLATLPPEADAAEVTACTMAGIPYNAKRVLLARYKDGSGLVFCVNPMGTHFSDVWLADVERVNSYCGPPSPPIRCFVKGRCRKCGKEDDYEGHTQDWQHLNAALGEIVCGVEDDMVLSPCCGAFVSPV